VLSKVPRTAHCRRNTVALAEGSFHKAQGPRDVLAAASAVAGMAEEVAVDVPSMGLLASRDSGFNCKSH
jgi:hypothetical protein